MTNSISSLAAGQISAEAASAAPASPRAGAGVDAAAPGESGESEAVTLSPNAQAAAQLLAAAQQSDGVDTKSVASIKAALQNGSYNVAPEDLAQAIATVLKETT
jgi:flagellar biosynthesis anti-sigma factor FlgM